MAKLVTGIPKGTRDFSPGEMVRRNYIFDTIRSVFKQYGYQPIETPAMENLSTLLGKYGEEGDKLLFRILNSGDFISKIPEYEINSINKSVPFESAQKITPFISEKGLRYDLTVPFARFVVQNRNDLQMPFKRYQIQPVWRADRPQKGRYREFYQCDADVIGSNSLLNETELIKIIDTVFTLLDIKVSVKLNNRKILAGIAGIIGLPEKLTDITVAIDKLEKTGEENVKKELYEKGIPVNSINTLIDIISLSGSNEERLKKLEGKISSSETGQKGIDELRKIFTFLDKVSLKNKVEIDLSLARGLNYYTGTIIEVKALDVEIGSICGGGRYDDLTGIFGLPDLSGVGISFGADRIYDVLNSLNNYPSDVNSSVKVMFTNFGENESAYCLPVLDKLQQEGISCLLYPDNAKLKKQMSYADVLKIPYVIIVGEEEIKSNEVTVKNMITGEQNRVSKDSVAETVNQD